jgi:hypothetical protein
MERDAFGLPIKRSNPQRASSERVTPIRLSHSPQLLSLPIKKAINPFVDPIPPKPRNPFDEEETSDNKLSDLFSSNHSYKQLSSHGNLADMLPPEPTKEDEDLEMNEEGEGEGVEEDGDNPLPYRLSQQRQSSRQSFRKIILKAERSMIKRGYGEEIVAVDKTDDNAVIRFLLSQRSIPFHLSLSDLSFHPSFCPPPPLHPPAFGYPGTDGTFFENYFNFVRDQHPLIGLVCHHKLHPFRTGPRIAIFLCLLGFSFAVSVALLNDFYFKQVRLTD